MRKVLRSWPKSDHSFAISIAVEILLYLSYIMLVKIVNIRGNALIAYARNRNEMTSWGKLARSMFATSRSGWYSSRP